MLSARFDEIFMAQTCYKTLNQALKRIYNNKAELLLVLDYPNIPLHNNLSLSRAFYYSDESLEPANHALFAKLAG